jgi:TatA/E family protein of Tat protein translocase
MLAMLGLGTTEILVILVVALLVLGPSKLPELAKSLGKGLRELRRASDDFQREMTRAQLDLDAKERQEREASRVGARPAVPNSEEPSPSPVTSPPPGTVAADSRLDDSADDVVATANSAPAPTSRANGPEKG